MAGALKAGVEAMGLGLNPEDDYWLPSLNAVRVPDGVDDGDVIDYVLEHYDLEIAAGLGDLSGEVFRIGCMGHGARPENVTLVVAALADAFEALDANVNADAGLAAVRESLQEN
jgi:alanine-glyoxylate transaminase/serine-glyoxylate transaminase/serine-pyruvate transaminase